MPWPGPTSSPASQRRGGGGLVSFSFFLLGGGKSFSPVCVCVCVRFWEFLACYIYIYIYIYISVSSSFLFGWGWQRKKRHPQADAACHFVPPASVAPKANGSSGRCQTTGLQRRVSGFRVTRQSKFLFFPNRKVFKQKNKAQATMLGICRLYTELPTFLEF